MYKKRVLKLFEDCKSLNYEIGINSINIAFRNDGFFILPLVLRGCVHTFSLHSEEVFIQLDKKRLLEVLK